MPEYPVFSIREWAIVDGRVECPRCGSKKHKVKGLWRRFRLNQAVPPPEGVIAVTCKCEACKHLFTVECVKAEVEWTE